MQKSTAFIEEYEIPYKISARVVDRENGMQNYDDIRMIRVTSKDYNILIMEDYMPLIGEIAGSVEVVTDSDVVRFDPIHGFFMHKKNCFYLLIEDHLAEGEEIAEADDLNDFDDSYIMEEFKNAGIFKASSSSSKTDSSKTTKSSEDSDGLEDLDL